MTLEDRVLAYAQTVDIFGQAELTKHLGTHASTTKRVLLELLESQEVKRKASTGRRNSLVFQYTIKDIPGFSYDFQRKPNKPPQEYKGTPYLMDDKSRWDKLREIARSQNKSYGFSGIQSCHGALEMAA